MYPVGKDRGKMKALPERPGRMKSLRGNFSLLCVMSRHPPPNETLEHWDPVHWSEATVELVLLSESWTFSPLAALYATQLLSSHRHCQGTTVWAGDPGNPWARNTCPPKLIVRVQHDSFSESRNNLLRAQNGRDV